MTRVADVPTAQGGETVPGDIPQTDEVREGERGLTDDSDAARGDDVAGGDLATEGSGDS
jgi:hypothetical protein